MAWNTVKRRYVKTLFLGCANKLSLWLQMATYNRLNLWWEI